MTQLKTPAEYAAELEVLEKTIASHLAAGEIDKPAYEGLKYKVDRALEGTSEVIAREHLYGKGGSVYELARYTRDEERWGVVVQIAPIHYAREVLAIEKKLGKIREAALKAHPLYKDLAAYADRYKEIAANLLALKDKTVSTKTRREQKKTTEEQARVQAFKKYKTLVVVLQEHLDSYVNRAGEMAAKSFEASMKLLETNGWDLNKTAPAGTRDDDHDTYYAKERYRSHFISLTDEVKDEENIRAYSIQKKARYVAQAKDAAHADYMAWIYKMIQKIGQPVTAATMNGDPWVQSVIEVTTKDGGKQTWHTQMIINYSKYQLAFHQFPSRRIEE